MTREEILEKSQQENQGQDIADLEVSKNGMRIGWLVVICLLAIVAVVDALVFERMNSEVFFAVTAATSVIFFYKYMKLRKLFSLLRGYFSSSDNEVPYGRQTDTEKPT